MIPINNRSRRGRKLAKDDKGVSPVVGVILMVAITVVMAAIVSSWSSGVKAPTTPTTVGLDISRSVDNITVIITSIDPASAAPIPSINYSFKYDLYGNGTFVTNSTDKYQINADVGNVIDIGTNNSTTQLLIITAIYKDASKKVLYSRDI